MSNILVLGGTGFVGRHVCEALQRAGHRMTVPTRHIKHAASVQHLPLLTVLTADVHDPVALNQLVAGHDIVINLVAILHGNEATFERTHVELPAKLAQACQSNGVKRVIHISALGAAADAPSMYQRSKARGEAVLQAAGLDLAVIRPSVIFGADDRFLNLFARLQRALPVIPLAGAACRFQPVWVEDVASAVLHAVANQHTVGQTIEAVGPEVFTLAELVHLAGKTAGCERRVFALPVALAYFQAVFMEMAPGEPLMSTDNLASMEVDNVASEPGAGVPNLSAWGLSAADLRAVLPTYLGTQPGGHSARSHLLALRSGVKV